VIDARTLALLLGLSRTPDQAAVDAVERAALDARVPVSLALAVCALESGLGTRGRILCGCYVRRADGAGVDTDVGAQARCVAGTLRVGLRSCGSWAASLRRYRYGLADHGCPLADPRAYVRRVQGYTRAQGRGLVL
jgi:hypothetical protein